MRRKETNRSKVTEVPSIVHEVLHSPGQPLDLSTREFFEPRFGHDFSQVQVHNDERANASVRAVDAYAYTTGQDIVFGAGAYRPHDPVGRSLLAHELVHTLQQKNYTGTTSNTSLEVGAANSPLESEADRVTEQVMSMSPQAMGSDQVHTLPTAPTISRSRPVLQRQARSRRPLIPIPVFDELDPMIIVPDIPGVPSFLRGRSVKLSTLRSALDVLRGNLPSLGGPGEDFCTRLLPDYETAPSGDVKGLCCPHFVRDRERCCRWQDIGLMSSRCCNTNEVVINGRCVRPQPAPTQPPPVPTVPTPRSSLPTLPRLELHTTPISIGTITSDTIDHFVLNHSELPTNPAVTDTLDRLARQLKIYSTAEVHVEGYTDSSASEEYNQRLSEQRAQAVRDALIRRGIDRRRIITQGFGETRLLFPSETNAEQKASNRRVEIWFYTPPSHVLGQEFRLQLPLLGGTGEGAR